MTLETTVRNVVQSIKRIPPEKKNHSHHHQTTFIQQPLGHDTASNPK